jgi:hypothetical protein
MNTAMSTLVELVYEVVLDELIDSSDILVEK